MKVKLTEKDRIDLQDGYPKIDFNFSEESLNWAKTTGLGLPVEVFTMYGLKHIGYKFLKEVYLSSN